MNITKKEIEKLCDLYYWLNAFTSLVTNKQLQELEDEYYKFRNRSIGLPRIQFELDSYHSLKHHYNSTPLSDRQRALKARMLSPKNKDIEQKKADVCQFLLELDSVDCNISMTSHLYTAYPMVRDRIYQDLLFLFENTKDKEIVNMTGKTLYNRKRFLYKQLKYLRSLLPTDQTSKSKQKSLNLKK